MLQKPKGFKTSVVEKPMILLEFNFGHQVTLIDFESQPGSDYKFIIIYQDHLTKSVVIHTLSK